MASDNRGFVLPLTLWVIALMGLAVAAINAWVTTATENARALQAKIANELAMSDLKNELVYDIGSRSMTQRGIEIGSDVDPENGTSDTNDMDAMFQTKETSAYIALDGRPYVFASNPDYVVQLYDARGLINLNSAGQVYTQRLLSLFDVPETLRNQLPDTLADWMDDDDLTRLAGAEKNDYERLQRHPPSNARLMTPLEVQSVLGWDRVPQIWQADLDTPLFTTCAIAGFNPNTASETALLTYVVGITKESVAQVLEQRRKEPFRATRDFMDAAGVTLPNEAFFLSLIPGGCVVVELTNTVTNERTRFSLSVLRVIQGQPWQVDYALRLPPRDRKSIVGLDPKITLPTPETIYAGSQGDNRTPGIRQPDPMGTQPVLPPAKSF
jgi:hypothetical protein